MRTLAMKKILLNSAPSTLKIIHPETINDKSDTPRKIWRYGNSQSTRPAEPMPNNATKNGMEQHGRDRKPNTTAKIPVRVLFESRLRVMTFLPLL